MPLFNQILIFLLKYSFLIKWMLMGAKKPNHSMVYFAILVGVGLVLLLILIVWGRFFNKK